MQTNGETMETVTDFIFLGSKITVDGDCSHEIKRCFLLGRKAMTNLDSILKSRDVTLPTKVHLVKATVFPVVMYGCKSWTVRKLSAWRRKWQPTPVFLPGESQGWRRAWWAAIYGVAQSRTQLKRLSSSSSRVPLS